MQKKQSFYNTALIAFVTMLIGTYLDLYFVGRKMYEFPLRPFPNIFTINIAFTLFILPCSTILFLMLMRKMNFLNRLVFTLCLSLIAITVENVVEQWGFFRHSSSWNHYYSFTGYLIYFYLIWTLFKGKGKEIKK